MHVKDLEETIRIFLKLADKSLENKIIDEKTYINITKKKKEFIEYIEKNKVG